MSTIAEEIQRLKQAKSDIKASIINKGVAVDDAATLDAYPALIDSIQTGESTLEILENKAVTITTNGTTEILPEELIDPLLEIYKTYDGMKKVTVTTNVKPKLTSNTKLANSTFTTIPIYDYSEIVDASYLFSYTNLQTLGDTFGCQNIHNAKGMFMSCRKLLYTTRKDPKLHSSEALPCLLNTDNITDMSNMFAYCTNLLGVTAPFGLIDDIFGFIDYRMKTDACTTMRSMFYQDIMLRIVPQFTSTSNVTDMGFMFWGCNDFNGFNCDYDMSKVTDIEGMFTNSTITSFTRNNGPLDFSSVTNATDAFKGCTDLTTLAGFTGLKASLSLSDCPLTVESINNVINEMYDFNANGLIPEEGQGTLTLGPDNLSKLSEEEKAVATNKGWTLA